MDNPPTANPVAVWGTSAGALNAMWASTLHAATRTRKLLDNWHSIAMLFSSAAIFVPAVLFGLIVGGIICSRNPSLLAFMSSGILSFTLWTVATVVLIEEFSFWGLIGAGALSCVTAGIALAMLGHQWVIAFLPLFLCITAPLVLLTFCCLLRLWSPSSRLPGLFSISWLARRLPSPQGPARFRVFLCTANVNLAQPPVEWNWNTLGVFQLLPGQNEPNLLTQDPNIRYDLRTAAMCSAALPILCQPYPLGQQLFLDGGLEANLPAGFILQQGPLGGRCVVCIIPRPIERLNPTNHAQYRTLRFLRALQEAQAHHRALIAATPAGVSSTHPGHVMYPILIVSPNEELESGLINGFLRPHILIGEFEADGRLPRPWLVL